MIVAILALRLVRGAVASLPSSSGRALVGVASVLVAAGFVAKGFPGLRTTRADVRWLRTQNMAFEGRLARSMNAADQGNATSIVLYARRGLDFEPVMSIARHLFVRNVTIPIYLRLAEDSERISDGAWERGLLATMKNWSAQGFEAIRSLPRAGTGKCFSFGFDGPPDPQCPMGTDIWPIRSDVWAAGH